MKFFISSISLILYQCVSPAKIQELKDLIRAIEDHEGFIAVFDYEAELSNIIQKSDIKAFESDMLVRNQKVASLKEKLRAKTDYGSLVSPTELAKIDAVRSDLENVQCIQLSENMHFNDLNQLKFDDLKV